MEWVETTARNVEEAKEILLDRLGVDTAEAEFDILEEPKPGLFGRTKGQARVRARVRPKAPPARDDRRRRSPKKGGNGNGAQEGRGGSSKAADAPADDSEGDAARGSSRDSAPAATKGDGKRSGGARNGGGSREPREPREPREARESAEPSGPRLDSEVARRESEAFLRELLGHFGVDGTIEIEIDELGDLSAQIRGEGLGRLIGPRGGVISAIEELTRTRLQHVASGGSTPRFKLDIGDYRGSRRANLEALVDEVVEKVRATGQPHVLDVVVAGERKAVHDRVAEIATDVQTHSEGEDPVRRVVLTLS